MLDSNYVASWSLQRARAADRRGHRRRPLSPGACPAVPQGLRGLRQQLQPQSAVAAGHLRPGRALAAWRRRLAVERWRRVRTQAGSRPGQGAAPPRPPGSVPLFDALAPTYEEHFAVPHRRAHDELAWELLQPPCPPPRPASWTWAVASGAGPGGWSPVATSSSVSSRHWGWPSWPGSWWPPGASSCELVELPMEVAELPAGQADLVLAMGSLQYSADPSGCWCVSAGGRGPASGWSCSSTRWSPWCSSCWRRARRTRPFSGWRRVGRERQLATEPRLAGSRLLSDADKQLWASGRILPSARIVDGDPVDLDVLGSGRPGRAS
jgi:hypothetical protein